MALLLSPKIVCFMRISYLFLLLIFTACSSGSNKKLDNIEEIKKDFIATILTESVLDEGPSQMNYHLRTILFSDNVRSNKNLLDIYIKVLLISNFYLLCYLLLH